MNDRQKELLKKVTLYPVFRNVDYFSDSLKVSKKTIYRDVEYINSSFFKKNSLILQRGLGLSLKVDESSYVSLINSLSQNQESRTYFDLNSSVRLQYILLMLLINHDTYFSQNEFAEKFYISKSTINKDIQDIKESLVDKNILIETSRSGTVLKGNLSSIRMQFLETLIALCDEKQNSKLEFSDDSLLPCRINELCPDLDFQKTDELILKLIILIESMILDELSFSEKRKVYLQFLVLIMFNMKTEREQLMSYQDIDSGQEDPFLPIANYLFNEINDFVSLDVKERDYILNALSQLNPVKRLKTQLFDKNKGECQIKEFICDFVDTLSIVTEIDLHSKEGFLERINSHVKEMIHRVFDNSQIGNEILKLVSSEYTDTLNICHVICRILEKKFNLPTISIDEISYLAVYIQSEIVSFTNKRKVLVLYEENKLFKEFVKIKLHDMFKEWTLDFCLLTKSLNLTRFSDYYIVINMTEYNFSKNYIPTIKISRFLNQDDVESLKLFDQKVNLVTEDPLVKLKQIFRNLSDLKIQISVSEQVNKNVLKTCETVLSFSGNRQKYVLLKSMDEIQECLITANRGMNEISEIKFIMNNYDYLLYCSKIIYLIEISTEHLLPNFLLSMSKEGMNFV